MSCHKKYSNVVVLLLAESVSITLEPDNPTQVLVNSEVVLRWNYTLGGDRFREVEFRRTRTGADEKIGLIDREVFLYLVFRSGRFEVQAPATLVIRNVTADDATDYILTVEAKTSSDIVTAESSITLDVLREFPFVFLILVWSATSLSLICLMCAVLLLRCVKYWKVVRNLGGCMVRRKCLHIKNVFIHVCDKLSPVSNVVLLLYWTQLIELILLWHGSGATF